MTTEPEPYDETASRGVEIRGGDRPSDYFPTIDEMFDALDAESDDS
jgi:hypothetical protein